MILATDHFARSASIALAQSMQRHGHTCESLAEWLSDIRPCSPTTVKRWRSPKSPRAIPFDRVMQLPPLVRRDLCAWLADIDNATVVERVGCEDGDETHAELALDSLRAINDLMQHASHVSIKASLSPDDALAGVEMCNASDVANGRLRLRYQSALESRGAVVRPGLRKANPVENVKKLEVA